MSPVLRFDLHLLTECRSAVIVRTNFSGRLLGGLERQREILRWIRRLIIGMAIEQAREVFEGVAMDRATHVRIARDVRYAAPSSFNPFFYGSHQNSDLQYVPLPV